MGTEQRPTTVQSTLLASFNFLNDDLKIMAISIDTWGKYVLIQLMMAFIVSSEEVMNLAVLPIFSWNIFNPDKTEIKGYGKRELLVCSSIFYLSLSLKRVVMVVISITQFDVAMLNVIYSELTSCFVIVSKLEDKTFVK